MALGGSTNVVLHLLAIAHEAEVELTLDDFDRIGSKVPPPGRHEALRALRDARRRPSRPVSPSS
ncbi:dihydroxy-acid dehydratase [Clavibacter tessellarius]|uniref:dihydroxy-acid dehydratase domain-containing protein n=1 Tax=Clavibacter tessellarius TaxID=31965 RepID=UPI0039BF0085